MAINRISPKKGKVVDIPDATITIGTATGGAEQASIAFTVATTPATGGPVQKYTAISNPGSFTGEASSSPVTVRGLTAGTEYTFQVAAANATGRGAYSSASNSVTPVAATIPVEFLIVAGGGAGGAAGGGGGGGGGSGGALYITQNVLQNQAITVTVGAGGTGYSYFTTETTAMKGGNSSVAYSGNTYTAFGGGTGKFRTSDNTLSLGGSNAGESNASQGIGPSTQTSQGGTAYGNIGGNSDSLIGAGGGGGGTGAVGGNSVGSGTKRGGHGGAGTSAFSTWLAAVSAPDTTYLAGGGGGGADGGSNTRSDGGAGGGGTGGTTNSIAGGNATASTGSGGGGGGGSQSASSGSGAGGVVYVRYASTYGNATGATTITSGGYKYYKFTGSGTLTLPSV